MARPTKLTLFTAARIINALRNCAYVETAVAFAGIHRDTFYEWLKRGAEGPWGTKAYDAWSDEIDKAAAVVGDTAAMALLADRRATAPAHFAAFSDTIEKAQAQGEILALGRISRAGGEHWQADAWRLERKFPRRWGRRLALGADLEEGEELDLSLTIRKPAAWPVPEKE